MDSPFGGLRETPETRPVPPGEPVTLAIRPEKIALHKGRAAALTAAPMPNTTGATPALPVSTTSFRLRVKGGFCAVALFPREEVWGQSFA